MNTQITTRQFEDPRIVAAVLEELYDGGTISIIGDRVSQANSEQWHHPWCNYWSLPRKDCKQCVGLFKKYPIELGESTDELISEHFPDVIRRT